MRTLLLLFLIGSATVATAPAAWAAEPGPGLTVTVECEGAPNQHYACYVPKAYVPSKDWPILYCFAPDANGQLFVERYQEVCEERGWIVVGSLNSRNGPWGPIQAAVDAVWADTHARFSISKTRCYASGFSGGSRVSFAVAGMKKDHFAGVIGIGAGLSSTGISPPKEVAVWIMCGETDMNRRELDALKPRLEAAGHEVHYETFPGAHVMPPDALLEKAVRWIDDLSGERRALVFQQAVTAALALQTEGDLVAAWWALKDALAATPDVKAGRRDAEKVVKALERDAAVKRERKAWSEYEKALTWLEKNRERCASFESPRAQARKKMARITTAFEGTRAADQAEARLVEIDALADESE